MSVVAELQETIERVAEAVGPSVVGVGHRPGSGVVVGEGSVLTNAHNLRRDEVRVAFGDGRTATAHVAGVDRDADLAVLSVDTAGARSIEWATEGDRAGVGAPVLALGRPGGRGLRVTLGFVSLVGRTLRGPRGRRVPGALEHTARLGRGSSGGPAVDADGRFVGLNTRRLRDGFSLAVPANEDLRRRIEALSRGESPAPLRLGVSVAPAYVARRLRRAVGLPERDGLLVRAVEAGSAADEAGVEEGDLIVAAAGRPVDTADALFDALHQAGPGGTLELGLVRGTEERAVEAVLAAAGEEV